MKVDCFVKKTGEIHEKKPDEGDLKLIISTWGVGMQASWSASAQIHDKEPALT